MCGFMEPDGEVKMANDRPMIEISGTKFRFRTNFAADPSRNRPGMRYPDLIPHATIDIPEDKAFELMAQGVYVSSKEDAETGNTDYYVEFHANFQPEGTYRARFNPMITLKKLSGEYVDLTEDQLKLLDDMNDNGLVKSVDVSGHVYKGENAKQAKFDLDTMIVEEGLDRDPLRARIMRERAERATRTYDPAEMQSPVEDDDLPF